MAVKKKITPPLINVNDLSWQADRRDPPAYYTAIYPAFGLPILWSLYLTQVLNLAKATDRLANWFKIMCFTSEEL